MSVDCEMLGALLSERRRGELPPDEARALDAHLAGCARCRDEARRLEPVLAMVEMPPPGAAELEALRSRRIGEAPRRMPARAGWQVPAVLVAAAAAALLTVSVRPVSPRQPERTGAAAVLPGETEGELLPAGDTQELFPELSAAEATDETVDTLDDDATSLEGPGLFGYLEG